MAYCRNFDEEFPFRGGKVGEIGELKEAEGYRRKSKPHAFRCDRCAGSALDCLIYSQWLQIWSNNSIKDQKTVTRGVRSGDRRYEKRRGQIW